MVYPPIVISMQVYRIPDIRYNIFRYEVSRIITLALIHLEFVVVPQRLPIWAFTIVMDFAAQYPDSYISGDKLIVLVEHAIISTFLFRFIVIVFA